MSLVPYFSRALQRTPKNSIVSLNETPENWDPSESSWVRTTLMVQHVNLRRPVDEKADFFADLSLKESHSDIPERFRPKSGTSEVFLSIPISGKEAALLSGLVGREVYLAGDQPKSVQTFRELQRENQELRDQLEDLQMFFQEIFASFQRRSGRRTNPYSE